MKNGKTKTPLSENSKRQKCYVVFHAQGRYMDKEIKFIGVFSTRKMAQECVNTLKTRAGFNRVGRFSIDLYLFDQINWSEGFVTV